jgi:predicted extracellular nuclease
MARSRTKTAAHQKAVSAALAVLARLPTPMKVGVVVLAVVGVGVLLFVQKKDEAAAKQATVTAGENEFLFCFWNVENLFDDKDDKRNSIDEEYDNPFAENKGLRELKYDRISSALLKMNDGKGPDVIACAEVESARAADLLKDALNAKLKEAKQDDKYQYKHVLMQNLEGGRHIAPCVISRVNVDVRNVKLTKPYRILETHLYVNQKDLCVITSHWTSQLKQRDGSDGDSGREKYAVAIYERFRELNAKNTSTDVLVCGDFNDTPDAEPIFKGLGAIGDASKVKPTADEPFLLNLMHGKDPKNYGTLWYNGKPLIYDHICVSPGMLDDKGWSVDPKSLATITEGLTKKGATRREPWRFGDPGKDIKDADRGYADHFPVVVKLKVEASK